MTCIIAIETATEACSAALLIENAGKQIIYKSFQLAPREHTKLILPMLDEVLDEADLKITDVDAIAFGRGPGAFTGLRIATGIAQGLALSVDKPTLPISSLFAMALLAKNEVLAKDDLYQNIIVAIDARMGEVYWAEYFINGETLELVGEEKLSQPAEMFQRTEALAQEKSIIVVGSGWDEYIHLFEESSETITALVHLREKFPDAAEIAQLALLNFEKGDIQSIEDAQPVYLRNNVAKKSKQ